MSWGIRAEFVSNDLTENTYVYFDGMTFVTELGAMEVIDREYEYLLTCLDMNNEEDLQGFYFGDFEPYELCDHIYDSYCPVCGIGS